MHVCYRRTCMCHRYTCLCHMHTCMCYRHTCIKVYTPTPTRTYTPCNTQIGVDTLTTRTDSDDKEIGVDTLITRKHHKEAGVDTLITRKHFLRGTRERALVCLESTYLYQHTHIRCKTRQHLRIGTRLALAKRDTPIYSNMPIATHTKTDCNTQIDVLQDRNMSTHLEQQEEADPDWR